MKTLNPTNRHPMERSGKSGAGVTHAVARKSNASRPAARSHQKQATRSTTRARSQSGHNSQGRPAPRISLAEVQYQAIVKSFEIGVRAFRKQDYEKAADIFEKLVDSDARDVAERARVHLRLCRQRTRRSAPLPKSADDHYALGIACLNFREIGQAVEHLTKADRIKPNQDHVQYALAVSRALEGNTDAAMTHLEAAFTLRPENRIHARRDEDFHGLSDDPRFRRLIYPTTS